MADMSVISTHFSTDIPSSDEEDEERRKPSLPREIQIGNKRQNNATQSDYQPSLSEESEDPLFINLSTSTPFVRAFMFNFKGITNWGDSQKAILYVPAFKGWGLVVPWVLKRKSEEVVLLDEYPRRQVDQLAMFGDIKYYENDWLDVDELMCGPGFTKRVGLDRVVRDVMEDAGLTGTYKSNIACGSWVRPRSKDGRCVGGVRFVPLESDIPNSAPVDAGFDVYSVGDYHRSVDEWIDSTTPADIVMRLAAEFVKQDLAKRDVERLALAG